MFNDVAAHYSNYTGTMQQMFKVTSHRLSIYQVSAISRSLAKQQLKSIYYLTSMLLQQPVVGFLDLQNLCLLQFQLSYPLPHSMELIAFW